MSILETLIHSTVNEMSTILTQTTADESVSMDFTVSLHKVFEICFHSFATVNTKCLMKDMKVRPNASIFLKGKHL